MPIHLRPLKRRTLNALYVVSTPASAIALTHAILIGLEWAAVGLAITAAHLFHRAYDRTTAHEQQVAEARGRAAEAARIAAEAELLLTDQPLADQAGLVARERSL